MLYRAGNTLYQQRCYEGANCVVRQSHRVLEGASTVVARVAVVTASKVNQG